MISMRSRHGEIEITDDDVFFYWSLGQYCITSRLIKLIDILERHLVPVRNI